ncbi:hypothetical protein [Salmonella phage SSBI34]|nr:hypothetical protein [Salmonella phage SSBI34]
MKIENVLICQDCAIYISNGELPANTSPEDDQDIIHGAEYLDISYKFGSVGSNLGFSINPCACCGSRLAGDRYEYDNLGLK